MGVERRFAVNVSCISFHFCMRKGARVELLRCNIMEISANACTGACCARVSMHYGAETAS